MLAGKTVRRGQHLPIFHPTEHRKIDHQLVLPSELKAHLPIFHPVGLVSTSQGNCFLGRTTSAQYSTAEKRDGPALCCYVPFSSIAISI